MREIPKLKLIWLTLLICVATITVRAADEDDNLDSNNRVARVTVVRGDVQIRRAGSQDWEIAAPNLPLLEGDRIATGQDSRAEIQFDRDNYLRLDADSILKIVTLNESGVAVSLPEGILSVRLGSFKNKRDSFEIDAPNTTIAAERAGRYRIDAPHDTRINEIKVTVTDGGQARIYTDTSGYTIRDGRAARIFLSGEYAGDADFSSDIGRDYFDDWIYSREETIANLRRDEYRDYYNENIYGADDLNEYGEWINSSRYGWVWRPYPNSTAAYNDWSPYRYGHWRYIQRYGWTWVADEPWGWATSHYGRWVYLDAGWSWCPDEYRDRRRSFWRPALVVFVNVGRDICWYPLPYGYRSSYNYRARTVVYQNIYNTTIINNYPPNNGINDPRRDAVTGPLQYGGTIIGQYVGAVSKMPVENFGKVERGITPVGEVDARRAIESFKNKGEVKVDLPVYVSNADAKILKNREIVVKRESLREAEREIDSSNAKIGAMPRAGGTTLDEKLRDERVFKGRTPVRPATDSSLAPAKETNNQPRIGVFERQPAVREKPQTDNNQPREDVFDRPVQSRERSPKPEVKKSGSDSNTRIVRMPGKVEPNGNERPAERPAPPRREERSENPTDNRPPASAPQPRQKEPEQRRIEPRTEQPSPRREEPRPAAPKEERDTPRPDPPKSREEPKHDNPTPVVKAEKPSFKNVRENE